MKGLAYPVWAITHSFPWHCTNTMTNGVPFHWHTPWMPRASRCIAGFDPALHQARACCSIQLFRTMGRTEQHPTGKRDATHLLLPCVRISARSRRDELCSRRRSWNPLARNRRCCPCRMHRQEHAFDCRDSRQRHLLAGAARLGILETSPGIESRQQAFHFESSSREGQLFHAGRPRPNSPRRRDDASAAQGTDHSYRRRLSPERDDATTSPQPLRLLRL